MKYYYYTVFKSNISVIVILLGNEVSSTEIQIFTGCSLKQIHNFDLDPNL